MLKIQAGCNIILMSTAGDQFTITQTAVNSPTVSTGRDPAYSEYRHFWSEGDLTLSNIILEGVKKTGNYYNGGVCAYESTLTLLDGAIISKCCDAFGGAVLVEGGTLLMQGGEISNNKAYEGGGVYISAGNDSSAGSSQITGGSIFGNDASYTYLQITGQSPIGVGGGIMLYDSTLEMGGSAKIAENTSDYGAIAVWGSSAITTTFIMDGGEIYDNVMSHYGGGVYVYTGGEFQLENGAIYDNVAGEEGGGVFTNFASSVKFSMTGGEITGNRAGRYGGGVYLGGGGSSSQVYTMTGGKINNNYAGATSGENLNGSGGGVGINNANFVVSEGAQINRNRASSGAGVRIFSGTFELRDSEIAYNEAQRYYNSSNNELSAGNGGGIYHSSGTVTIGNGGVVHHRMPDFY